MTSEKRKKVKPLPASIHYSVVIIYFGTVVITSLAWSLLFNFVSNDGNMIRTVSILSFTVFTPIIGFLLGWWRKWDWTKHKGTEEQFQDVRALFWATLGFLVAFILSLFLILIWLIMLEQDALLPQSLPDPIIFTISSIILIIGVMIGWNTRNRILRNFNE